jgi:hypothetical protein
VFEVSELVLTPTPEPWGPPPLTKRSSIRTSMLIDSTFTDDRFMAISGHSAKTSTATFLLTSFDLPNALIVDTKVTVSLASVIGIYISATHLYIYQDLDESAHTVVYELPPLVEALNALTQNTTVEIPPSHTRILPFDLESRFTIPIARRTWLFSNWSGVGRLPTLSCPPARVNVSHDNATAMWTVVYHDLRHISSHNSEEEVHRHIYSVPDDRVATPLSVGRSIWPFQGGYAGYVGWDIDLRMVFKLISFVGEDKPKEFIIELPTFINCSDIRDVDMSVAWGLMVFCTTDSTAYFISLI